MEYISQSLRERERNNTYKMFDRLLNTILNSSIIIVTSNELAFHALGPDSYM
jgi:hypothetical protein